MTIGEILATNRPISRFFSFGLFFPAIILCFPLLQGVKKACPKRTLHVVSPIVGTKLSK